MRKTQILISMLIVILCLSCTYDSDNLIENEIRTEEIANKRLQLSKPVISKIQGLCGVTKGNSRMPVSANQLNQLKNNFAPLPPINVTVKYHIVRNGNGSDGIPLSEIALMNNKLNQDFSQALYGCIQFPIAPNRLKFSPSSSVNYINSDEFYIIDNIEEFDRLIDQYNVPENLNIYVVKRFRQANILGRAKLPGNGAVLSRVNDAYLSTTFAHEVGHNFGLNHLSHDSFGLSCNYDEHNCSPNSGDLIADTPITIPLALDLIDENCEVDTNIYHGEGCPPIVVEMPKQDILFGAKNIMMKFLPEGPCREGFTGMQHMQMNQMAINLEVGTE